MVQKLLVMERDTEEQLQDAINHNILQADNNSRISAISVLKHTIKRPKPLSTEYYKAWIIVEVPENKEKLYEMAVGFES